MKKYKVVEVSEKEFEDLIRQGTDLIEGGLRYIDHQRHTDQGRLDILMVDSGNALAVGELKVSEDDGILIQGLDYYDYVSNSIERIARLYKDFSIDPSQPIRLILIAPSFSVSLINRCKWIDIPISLFTYKCIVPDGSKDIVPVFIETTIPSVPEPFQAYNLSDRLKYMTDPEASRMVDELIKEIQSWDPSKILIEPTKNDISLKLSGRVFSYIGPRRKYFIVYTYDTEKKWTGYPIHQKEDLEPVRGLLKSNVERLG